MHVVSLNDIRVSSIEDLTDAYKTISSRTRKSLLDVSGSSMFFAGGSIRSSSTRSAAVRLRCQEPYYMVRGVRLRDTEGPTYLLKARGGSNSWQPFVTPSLPVWRCGETSEPYHAPDAHTTTAGRPHDQL